MRDLSHYKINAASSIREAFRKSALNKADCVFVNDSEENILGIVTDGDFRRAIWSGVSLEQSVASIMNTDYVYFEKRYRVSDVVQRFSSMDIRQIPILSERKLVDLLIRDDFDHFQIPVNSRISSIPVVIMAGGKGTRLAPFTDILPKPLIPIAEKPVIDHIIDKFSGFGIHDYYISVNYKKKMIRAYFEDSENEQNIRFLEEEKFLGTAGVLSKLHGQINIPFFVTNCDIIINSDYNEIFDFHESKGNDLTLIGALQQHIIPYGICQMRDGGTLEKMNEKPRYDFLANTGLYVMNPDVLSYIPENQHFDMTDLINALQQNRRRVGVYPVSGESWIDVGQWDEYRKAHEQNTFLPAERVVNG